jgi:hypothetical protein
MIFQSLGILGYELHCPRSGIEGKYDALKALHQTDLKTYVFSGSCAIADRVPVEAINGNDPPSIA